MNPIFLKMDHFFQLVSKKTLLIEGLRFVRTLATLGIINATDSLYKYKILQG